MSAKKPQSSASQVSKGLLKTQSQQTTAKAEPIKNIANSTNPAKSKESAKNFVKSATPKVATQAIKKPTVLKAQPIKITQTKKPLTTQEKEKKLAAVKLPKKNDVKTKSKISASVKATATKTFSARSQTISSSSTKTTSQSKPAAPANEKNHTVWETSAKLFNTQMHYWTDYVHLCQKLSHKWLPSINGIMPGHQSENADEKIKHEDRRFQHEAWNNQPFYEFLKEFYLLSSKHIKKFFDELSIQFDDPKIKHQLHFYVRSWLDAMAPSNFLFTNPEAFELAMQTQGQSLLQGLKHFVNDFEHDSGFLHTKLTDLSAFEPGRNLAITPGKVVYKNDLMELILYKPQTEKVHQTPILLLPPWINKYYILDLQAHNSLVNWLVKKGFTVFLVSWVNPSKAHANKEFSDYLLEGPLAAVEFIREKITTLPINILGYCIGGTLLGCFLSHLTSLRKSHYINSATFLTSLFDFSNPGDLGVFIDESQLAKLHEHMQRKGYLEASMMAATFNSLRANDLIWNYYVNNYLKGHKPPAFDLLYWNSDSTNMPAKVHHFYLYEMYLKNKLIQKNGLKLAGIPIDLSSIKIPTYFLATREDHIAPWTACYNGMLKLSGLNRFVLAGSGHVAGVINPPDKNKYGYWLNSNHVADPLNWLEKAEYKAGSWWNDWAKWLENNSGPLIQAAERSKLLINALADAPGAYVKQQGDNKMPKEFRHFFADKMQSFFLNALQDITKMQDKNQVTEKI